ncbi:hypothetical protein J4E93_006429 [Alternaria ventricosa]|uniref:uncharacterized protein n=1 Tax=Alternaria ventricosa TaxID=1187951 RepID=UPI0020C328C4|nr:uncharacterized protein J4E93_006429 [Alternaria ventricosa]KAI4644524.1 hypothetical protein J4E93_006429 [Alternaria ventricosa]
MENYDQLRQPGTLSKQPLTQTIRDAMTFVKSLGERYLWVDTMCIIQDDAANKASALAQMCAIYSCAMATIVALNGDSADAGLPGIPPTTRNTTATFVTPGLHMVERSSLENVLANHTYDGVDVDCIYNTRAWTFQERLLSNRSIYFLGEQVYFHCKKQLLCEDRYISDDTSFYTLDKMRTTSAELKSKTARVGTYSPLDEFRWYEEIVAEYTAKKMGFPDDILNAFTGIQTMLSRMFDWPFVGGLPTSLLDLALLWTPVTTIERRLTASQQPSWSWSGWIGRVRYADLVRPGHRPISSLFRPLAKHQLAMPATIVFECMSVPLKAFELSKAPKGLFDPFQSTSSPITEDSYYVFDSNKRRCGMLIGLPQEHVLSIASRGLKLLALSAWKSNNSLIKNGPVISHLSDNGYTSDEEVYDQAFRDAEWCTYNVMLVRSVGGAYERVAVGQMHVDAWHGAGETRGRFAVN